MNIFVYSDESGVLDKEHQDWYVFAGVIFFSKEDKDVASRKYNKAENAIKQNYTGASELKGNILKPKHKQSLYRSLNKEKKFGVVIDQSKIEANIFNNKKSKQRYLDYAYKIGVKRFFEHYIKSGEIVPKEIENIYFYIDEHTTATDGKYELEESLRQEFKIGTHNYNWNKFYPPIFPKLKSISVNYRNSEKTSLIRASDIVANNLYNKVRNPKKLSITQDNFIITYLP